MRPPQPARANDCTYSCSSPLTLTDSPWHPFQRLFLASCCGLPPLDDRSFDERRCRGRQLVLVVLCSRRPSRGLLELQRDLGEPAERVVPFDRFSRALRPSICGLFRATKTGGIKPPVLRLYDLQYYFFLGSLPLSMAKVDTMTCFSSTLLGLVTMTPYSPLGRVSKTSR